MGKVQQCSGTSRTTRKRCTRQVAEGKKYCGTCLGIAGPKTADISSINTKEVILESGEKTFIASDYNLIQEVINKLEKIQRKTEKRGIGSVNWEVESILRTTGLEFFDEEVEHRIKVKYEVPSGVEGVQVIGLLKDNLNGISAMAFGGNETVREMSDMVDWHRCDSCGVQHKKNKILVLQSDEGDVVQVGGECVKKYMGRDFNIDNALSISDELGNIWGGETSLNKSHFPLNMIVSIASAVSQQGENYISLNESRNRGKEATSSIVHETLQGDAKTIENNAFQLGAFEPEHQEFAKAALVWAANLDESNMGDYLFNLRQTASSGIVSRKGIGVAASVVTAYRKHLEKVEAEKEKEAARTSGAFVGTPGDKLPKTDLTVNKVIALPEGMYGRPYLIIMEDDKGRTYVTKTTGALADCEIGEEISMSSARVDEHKMFDGIPQTHVKNLRFKSKNAKWREGDFEPDDVKELLRTGSTKQLELAVRNIVYSGNMDDYEKAFWISTANHLDESDHPSIRQTAYDFLSDYLEN